MAANGIKRKGGKLNPVFGGKKVELDRLHAIVSRRGGYEAVTEERGWREVANVLDVRGAGRGGVGWGVDVGGQSTCGGTGAGAAQRALLPAGA